MNARDIAALLATVRGEARGEPAEGKRLVAEVLARRAQKRGTSIEHEAHRPWQFSCWNSADPNRELCASEERTLLAVLSVEANGSSPTHYHTRAIAPAWAVGHAPCTAVGAHLFYNDVR